ncbi:sugar ABC transporter permease [Alicyclobacillus fastidiosus]|uniref:Sugar ABC transporter permease n=1 Tax=Alicyclobacillus fastidiosus TaxID=392011 RepID=A0ABY6ZI76_9BACL|nr:sugar ABC transporter permease [Alicyclobacillus fastidiosus]WAH42526.1 sugar ABC transporter permease [Alicyclobacillus fastidiosus]GMA64369.1 ABC transporter permease [Alicyclobacillus fastidiosus]
MDTSTQALVVKPNSVVKKNSKNSVLKNLSAYGFMTPWLLGMLLLTAGSMLFTLYLTFTNYDLLSRPQFIGLSNFTQIFKDPNFWTSIRVTFIYVVLSVPARLIASLLVATLVSKQVRGIAVYRALIYLPSLIGGSVGASIGWRELFDQNGPIDSFLKLFGIHGPVWLGNPATSMIVLVLLSVWQFGSEMVIFLAGIKQIPGYLYESATIDGASNFQRYIRITLPMLSPLIFFNLLMGTISSFMVFTQVLVITDGGPMNSTLLYVLYLYQQAFQFFHMGYAAALSIILLILIALCSGFIFLTARFWVNYDV